MAADAAAPRAPDTGSPGATSDDGGATTQSLDSGFASDGSPTRDEEPPPEPDAAGPAPQADAANTPDSPDTGDAYDANPGAAHDAGPAPVTLTVDVEFFDWADNAPAGNEIAYPRSGGFPTAHEVASGSGTYVDPITFGGDSKVFPPGTVLYVPYLQKYVMLEDECLMCATQATMTHRPAISVWMASDASTPVGPISKCEMFWTRSSVAVIEYPPADLSVSGAPLFDSTTKTCRTTP